MRQAPTRSRGNRALCKSSLGPCLASLREWALSKDSVFYPPAPRRALCTFCRFTPLSTRNTLQRPSTVPQSTTFFWGGVVFTRNTPHIFVKITTFHRLGMRKALWGPCRKPRSGCKSNRHVSISTPTDIAFKRWRASQHWRLGGSRHLPR